MTAENKAQNSAFNLTEADLAGVAGGRKSYEDEFQGLTDALSNMAENLVAKHAACGGPITDLGKLSAEGVPAVSNAGYLCLSCHEHHQKLEDFDYVPLEGK